MGAMGANDDVLEAFIEANEVDEVLASFAALANSAGVDLDADTGLGLYGRLRTACRATVSKFKLKRIFEVLDKAVARRRALVLEDGASFPALDAGASSDEGEGDHLPVMRVVVSGAGPVGLRAAIENALLGHEVVVVEKRERFSRVNILMFWQATMDDMVALGAKLFYPQLRTHGTPLHMGTREIQLCLLKTALLLGVTVRYSTMVRALRYSPDLEAWTAIASPATSKPPASGARRLSARLTDALGFKPNKTADYEATFKCNMVDDPPLDESFLRGTPAQTDTELVFDALVVAEGEWSQTLRRLGFHKTVDRFSRAIGIVINMDYDASDDVEKALQSFALGLAPTQAAVKDRLQEKGIFIENIEYLKGTTHYIVATLWKVSSLFEYGVLKEDARGAEDLLQPENLDFEALKTFAREMATAVGIPESAPFCAWNPIQLFDFSTRARAMRPMKVLTLDDDAGLPVVLDQLDPEVDGTAQPSAIVMPVGDALLEPFWPQGLGSNRGFHGAIDSAYACLRFRAAGLYESYVSRAFSYLCMNMFAWSKPAVVLQSFLAWTADPVTRYSAIVVDAAKKQSPRILGIPAPPSVLRRSA